MEPSKVNLKQTSEHFKQDWQLNARLRGKYESIAATVGKCVFCDLRDKYIVARNKYSVLTVNIFPYINGQLLVLPKRHIERFEELTEQEILAFHKMTKKGLRLLREKLNVEDIWVILRDGKVSGKTVTHLHVNIMPYIKELNTWHYQKITIAPIDLAVRLRRRS